ncbi:MAG: hypothetical protein AB2L24_08620 [Mangrovibacterium sp.]
MKPLNSLAVLVWLLIISCITGYAQTTYRFGYNDSGDRTGREEVEQKSAGVTKSADIATALTDNPVRPDTLKGILDGRIIQIYPNPTPGILKVEVDLSGLEQQFTMQIRNPQDSLIADQAVVREITSVDLTDRPLGSYRVKIFSGDEACEWKILKE